MPVYEYQCPEGHVTELVLPMADEKPATTHCTHPVEPTNTANDTLAASAWGRYERNPDDPEGPPVFVGHVCGADAARVWEPWAATIYKGAGTYTSDYKLKYDRKRRPNPGDDLPLPLEAAITRAEGAEYDPPKRLPGGVIPRG